MHMDVWGTSFGSFKQPQVCVPCTPKRSHDSVAPSSAQKPKPELNLLNPLHAEQHQQVGSRDMTNLHDTSAGCTLWLPLTDGPKGEACIMYGLTCEVWVDATLHAGL